MSVAPTNICPARLDCPHCPRTFRRLMSLFGHMRIHDTGIRHSDDTSSPPRTSDNSPISNTTITPSTSATIADLIPTATNTTDTNLPFTYCYLACISRISLPDLVRGSECAPGYNKSSTGSCYRILTAGRDFCSAASYCLLEEGMRLKHHVSLPVRDISGLLESLHLPTQSWAGAFTMGTMGAELQNLSVQLIFPRARGTPLPDHILTKLPSPPTVGQCLAVIDAVTYRLVDCGIQLPFLCEYEPDGWVEVYGGGDGEASSQPPVINARFDRDFPLPVGESSDSRDAHLSCLQRTTGRHSRYSCAAECGRRTECRGFFYAEDTRDCAVYSHLDALLPHQWLLGRTWIRYGRVDIQPAGA
ncbi:hypothetical protein SprV_0902690600 [Sparganum proliferum]